jgi:3-hydroxy acid dehydrogenase/malonic semialdehyde reductase
VGKQIIGIPEFDKGRDRGFDKGSNMKTSLKGKWVLITGASSGFGAAAARAFGAEGSKVVLGARRVDRLEKVAAEALKAGAAGAHVHKLDVSRTASVEEFVAWTRQLVGSAKLDVLINNAGGAQGLDVIAEGKDADWEEMLQSNVLGVVRMTRAALPLLLGNPGASLINIGSYAARVAYEGGGVYCAAKAGELLITRTLRLELNGTGIRVSSIDPGLARTEFADVRFKGDQARVERLYEGTQPLTGEDIADILVWVASRPAHVNIDEMLIKPVDQASMTKIHRRTR